MGRLDIVYRDKLYFIRFLIECMYLQLLDSNATESTNK